MRIGLGTSNLRSLGRRAPLAAIVDLLEAGSRSGVRLIDTADTYGAGSAERSLAAAVRRSSLLTAERAQLQIVTKIGYRTPDLPGPLQVLNQPAKKLVQRSKRPQAFDGPSLRRAWAGSRRRLGDLPVHACCLHNPAREVLVDGEALAAVIALQQAGEFRSAGVSVDDPSGAAMLADLDGLGLVELPAALWMTLPIGDRERLRARGVEVVVNRVTAVDADPVAALRRLLLSEMPPDVAVIGTRNAAHLVADAEAVRE